MRRVMELRWPKTSEQILAMEAGREMDALVAERIFGGDPWRDIWGCPTCGYDGLYPYRDMGPPRFSTDIAAAWEVLDAPILCRLDFILETMDGWTCTINDAGGRGSATLSVSASANTAPLAICRAALLAVLAE